MTTIAQLNEKLFSLVKTGSNVTQDYCQIFSQMSVDDIANEDKRTFMTLCPMEYAAKTGNHDLIGTLTIMDVCNPQDDFDASLSKGLISAIRAGKTQTVKELLNFRAYSNDVVEINSANGKLSITPFDFACNYKDYDSVWTLIDMRGFSDGALFHAVTAADNYRVIDLLLNPRAHGIEICKDLTKSHHKMLDNCPMSSILSVCHETNLRAIRDHHNS